MRVRNDWRKRILIGVMSATAVGLASAAWAQTRQDVLAPPPVITFSNWREVGTYDWATEYTIEFPSPVPSGDAKNDVVPLRIFLPEGGKRPLPLVLITHYWGATDLRAEVALAQELGKKGIASAVLTLPYHLSRTPKGARSGELAIQPDPAALRRTTFQSVQDMRRALDFLSSRPEFRKDKIGLAGTSLGAIVSALTYAIDPRITEASFILGGIDLADLLTSSSRVVLAREELRRKGYDLPKLTEELAPIEPANYLPRSQPGNAFVVMAKYDTVIPSKNSNLLVEKLPGASTLSIDTGHYGGIFVQRRLQRETSNFFAAKFTNSEYNPPARLYAPTIRLGVTADPRGLDVGAGLDLWPLDPERKALVTAFLSPRGPSVWLHRQIGSGFSLGAFAAPSRVGVGILWSSVL